MRHRWKHPYHLSQSPRFNCCRFTHLTCTSSYLSFASTNAWERQSGSKIAGRSRRGAQVEGAGCDGGVQAGGGKAVESRVRGGSEVSCACVCLAGAADFLRRLLLLTEWHSYNPPIMSLAKGYKFENRPAHSIFAKLRYILGQSSVVSIKGGEVKSLLSSLMVTRCVTSL